MIKPLSYTDWPDTMRVFHSRQTGSQKLAANTRQASERHAYLVHNLTPGITCYLNIVGMYYHSNVYCDDSGSLFLSQYNLGKIVQIH